MKQFTTIVLAIAVFSGFCNAETNVSAKRATLADYQHGEKWVWKYKGQTKTGIVRSEGIDTKSIEMKNGELYYVTAHGEAPVATLLARKETKTPRYDWPLEVGKTWVYESSWTNEDGSNSGVSRQNAEVLSYQEETVEAGTFMAYKIKYTGTITGPNGISADTVDVQWYAPKVKTFIKYTQSQDDFIYVEELKSYSISKE
jgi:hypothetical protein